MSSRRIEVVHSSTYIELIKERGPLTVWEMSVAVETDVFRVQEKLDPVIKEGKIAPFEEKGRTYYKIPDDDGSRKQSRSFLSSFFNRNLEFEPIPKRIATKEILSSKNNYKKLIQEAYV